VHWLAWRLGKPLFRVDLAAVSSKYIGETEKNLSQLLARAEHGDGILLFDEADALFGVRTEVKQANDRFANAQTNYLLQRIESFEGVAILTANSKARFDDAFMRRLDAVVEFPLPNAVERRALWDAHLGSDHDVEASALARLAAEVDLPGGHIRNAVFTAALLARARAERPRIELRDVLQGIALEYAKLGRQAPGAVVAIE
jgi:SpoVK/Ycf46/Vps4 family AAA+-type ATPase